MSTAAPAAQNSFTTAAPPATSVHLVLAALHDTQRQYQNCVAVRQATAHGELLYQQVPSWCLKWNYRWPGLLAEIVHYKPDVMSLQEVDHFDELAARLEPLG